ncbi:36673_t:CDS:2, partial [Racocetra persica]
DELIFNTHTNENDTLNLEEDQWTKGSHINDYFKISRREKNKQIEDSFFENNKETNRLLPDLQSISTHDQFLINNKNQPDHEYINDNQQAENSREAMTRNEFTKLIKKIKEKEITLVI